MGLREQTGKVGKSWYAALAGVGLLVCAWSVPGLAATDSMVDCGELTGNAESFEIRHDALSFEPVDHIATEEHSATADAIDVAPESVETPTPVLYLTPRVAAILRNVFGSEIDGIDTSTGTETAASVDELTREPDAPIADSADLVDGEEIVPPATLLERSEDARRFQQQMYRTDI